jgi:hypothetical protein
MTRILLFLFACLTFLGEPYAVFNGPLIKGAKTQDTASVALTRADSLRDSLAAAYPPDAAGTKQTTSTTAQGVVSLIAGVVMVPMGMGVIAANSVSKCEEPHESMSGFGGGVGICDKDGPNTGGKFVGGGLSLAGLYLIGLGLYYIAK